MDGVHELTKKEAHELFDRLAQRHLRMSGQEFVDAYNAGKFPDVDESPGIAELVLLLPLMC